MQRWSILVVALLVGSAAPARAWCEATCLAAQEESAAPHCPSHDSSDTTSLSATDTADCPVINSARPVPTKLDLGLSIATAASHLRTFAPSHLRTLAPPHPRTSGFFERAVPVRI